MKLIPKFEGEILSKYGYQKVVGNRSKKHPDKHLFFMDWLNKTFPDKYKDVKEGDYFMVWNGDRTPVPFVQMKDERPDKWNRPTRLLDGSYYGLDPDQRIRICTHEETVKLKREIMACYY